MAGGFQANTRQKVIRLPRMTKPTGGGITTIELPKAGLLSRLYLAIEITTAGTITTQTPLGACAAIKRVRLQANNGIDLFNVSGAGNFYLLQNAQELQGVNGRQPQNQGNTTLVTATTYKLDMIIPAMLNMHDPVGMVLLQDEQLQVLLTIEWEADASVILTGGGTLTGFCDTAMEFFTVPSDPADLPKLNVVHQIIEDQITVSGAGDYIYSPPRGNTYLQLLLGYGMDAAPTDDWSRLIVRINSSDVLYDLTPRLLDQLVGYRNNLTRIAGTIPLDWLGSDGLGNYGTARDFINSGLLTDFQAVLTATGANTLYAIRRMLMPLN